MLTLISMSLSVCLQIYIYFNFKNFVFANIKNVLEVINNKKSYVSGIRKGVVQLIRGNEKDWEKIKKQSLKSTELLSFGIRFIKTLCKNLSSYIGRFSRPNG